MLINVLLGTEKIDDKSMKEQISPQTASSAPRRSYQAIGKQKFVKSSTTEW